MRFDDACRLHKQGIISDDQMRWLVSRALKEKGYGQPTASAGPHSTTTSPSEKPTPADKVEQPSHQRTSLKDTVRAVVDAHFKAGAPPAQDDGAWVAGHPRSRNRRRRQFREGTDCSHLSTAEIERILDLCAQGFDNNEVAATVGRTQTTVHRLRRDDRRRGALAHYVYKQWRERNPDADLSPRPVGTAPRAPVTGASKP